MGFSLFSDDDLKQWEEFCLAYIESDNELPTKLESKLYLFQDVSTYISYPDSCTLGADITAYYLSLIQEKKQPDEDSETLTVYKEEIAYFKQRFEHEHI